MDKLLTKKQVCEIVGRPYISIYKEVKKGLFPRPVKQGDHQFARIYWWQSEIQEYLNALPRQTYLNDQDRTATDADQARREAGRKGGLAKARNRKLKQQLQQPPRRRLQKGRGQ